MKRLNDILTIVILLLALPCIATATEWQIQTIDSEGGQYTSLVVDSNGYPHIVYSAGGQVKYAYWTGSIWSIQPIDSGIPGNRALVLDSNDYPHIVYVRYAGQSIFLKYAYKDGMVWHVQDVDSVYLGHLGNSSLALDSSDYPHISYVVGDVGLRGLRYAYWDGENWNKQQVYDVKDYFLGITSIVLDSNDYPHISSYHTEGYLYHSYWDGASWQRELIEGGSYQDVDVYHSLAIDDFDFLHISYNYDWPDSNLKYGTSDGSGWVTQRIDTEGDVGYYSSLALDSNNYPHISYYDATNGRLKYAYWDGANWQIQVVDGETEDVGQYTSIAIDSNGYPHISYYDVTNSALKYATSAPLSGAINGHVTDCQTGDPIKWALVIAIQKPTKIRTFTDRDGYYEISDLEPGEWWLIGIKRGYKLHIARVEVPTTHDFCLQPK